MALALQGCPWPTDVLQLLCSWRTAGGKHKHQQHDIVTGKPKVHALHAWTWSDTVHTQRVVVSCRHQPGAPCATHQQCSRLHYGGLAHGRLMLH